MILPDMLQKSEQWLQNTMLERKELAKAIHSILSPSGADKWSDCTQSLVGMLDTIIYSTDNILAMEGTLAHFVLELSITLWVRPSKLKKLDWPKDLVGEAIDSFKRSLDNQYNSDEVKEYAKECLSIITNKNFSEEMLDEVDKCFQRIKVYGDDGWAISAERKVSLYSYFGHKHCDGTADVIMYKGNRVIVADLKYGKGIEVSPYYNKQARLYAGGALAWLYEEFGYTFTEITIVIMQPRIGNGAWKEWTLSYGGEDGLYNYLMEVKEQSIIALAVISGLIDGVYEATTKTCQWCHRRLGCIGRYKKYLELMDEVNNMPDLNEIDNEKLGELLDKKPFIISYLNDAEKLANKKLTGGEVIPGWKLVKGRASNNWSIKDQNLMIQTLVTLGYEITECVETKIKSPAQMKKVKKQDKEVRKAMEQQIITTYGNPVLAPESDSRAKIPSASEAFAQAGY